MWPFRHLGLKALALMIALMLWLAVAGEQTVERVLRVPLELQQFPTQLELVGDFPTTVDVRVRGSSGALSRVGSGDVVAVLDLNTAEPGPHLFRLGADDVRAPFGVQVVQVNPTTVPLTFIDTASRRAGANRPDGQLVDRTIPDRPLDIRNVPQNLTAAVRPADVDVQLRGRRDALVRVQPADVKMFVDLAGLSPGDYALTVRAEVPRDVAVARIEPSTVQVRIRQ
jgi:YbbR domain-containing protein